MRAASGGGAGTNINWRLSLRARAPHPMPRRVAALLCWARPVCPTKCASLARWECRAARAQAAIVATPDATRCPGHNGRRQRSGSARAHAATTQQLQSPTLPPPSHRAWHRRRGAEAATVAGSWPASLPRRLFGGRIASTSPRGRFVEAKGIRVAPLEGRKQTKARAGRERGRGPAAASLGRAALQLATGTQEIHPRLRSFGNSLPRWQGLAHRARGGC